MLLQLMLHRHAQTTDLDKTGPKTLWQDPKTARKLTKNAGRAQNVPKDPPSERNWNPHPLGTARLAAFFACWREAQSTQSRTSRPHRRGLDAVTSVWASNIFETKPGSFVGTVCMAFNVKKHGDMALASPSMEKLLSPSIPAPVFNDASFCKQYGYHRRCLEVETDIEKGAWAAWLLGVSSAS